MSVDFNPLSVDPPYFIEQFDRDLAHWYRDHPLSDDEASLLCDLAETVDRLVREHDRHDVELDGEAS